VRVRVQGVVTTLDMDDYVAGVVAGELAVGALPAEVAGRMLALQAIVARTWVVANLGRHAREGFDVCTSTHCQVMRAPPDVLRANRPLVRSAAAATRGQVLRYGSRPIDAVFHADCGGATSRPDAVWGTAGHPYLARVADPSCLTDARSPWRHEATREQLRTALNGSASTAVGRRLDGIRVVENDASGRAALVALDGERSPLVRGEELRAVLTRAFGPRAIRSTLFGVRREGDRFTVAGRGFGHGVGLCQRGALARVLAGASVEAVLQTYYPGTTLDPPR
jgi:stage II sporulation protein D